MAPGFFSDSIGNVIKQGTYDSGVLAGEWKYNFSNARSFNIDWRKYESKKFNFYTNVPAMLTKVEEGDFFTKFQKSDTLKTIALVVAIHDADAMPFSLKEYFKQSEKEISDRGWSFSRQTTKLQADGNTFYMSFFKLKKGDENRVIWNSYGPIEAGKILEITTNFDVSEDTLGRILFTSVSSNIFVNRKRYLYLYRSSK